MQSKKAKSTNKNFERPVFLQNSEDHEKAVRLLNDRVPGKWTVMNFEISTPHFSGRPIGVRVIHESDGVDGLLVYGKQEWHWAEIQYCRSVEEFADIALRVMRFETMSRNKLLMKRLKGS